MFICGFISFTVWSSFTVRIISLSHSHIPPLRPVPAPSHSTLPAPSMAIKILSATLLKNYRAFPFIRVLLVVLLEKIPLAHANWVQTRRVPSSPSSRYIVSLSFLVRLGLSAFRPRRATVSTIRFLFRVYSLLGCLFPLVACICPILSPFVYLVLVHTVLGGFSILIFYPSFSLPLSLSLSRNQFTSLSFVFRLSLTIFRWYSRLSFSFHSLSPGISLSLGQASLSCLVLTCTICFSPLLPFLLLPFFLSFFFNLSLASFY